MLYSVIDIGCICCNDPLKSIVVGVYNSKSEADRIAQLCRYGNDSTMHSYQVIQISDFTFQNPRYESIIDRGSKILHAITLKTLRTDYLKLRCSSSV